MLEAPPADKAAYRKLTAVCNTWNDFSRVVTCTLNKGTVVAIGSTQSAVCTARPTGCAALPKEWETSFGSCPEHQVFLNIFRRTQADVEKFLEGCSSRACRGAGGIVQSELRGSSSPAPGLTQRC